MLFLFDTNAFSDLMRGDAKVLVRLGGLPSTDRVVTCTIVMGEIRYGIERLPEGKRRRDLDAAATTIAAGFVCEVVPASAADHYSRIKLARQKSGVSLDENDLWIAATSIALGAVLVSRDTDVLNISGLKVENWAK
ncbi:MAG TPA: PIN domain-containing protein [Tepidisphaeraceae bacterium]|jgi:predicted nucleic acid-binding protein|nr:PIN domain-containing protein [Tepidisphaeraceae bacterium]